MAPNNITNGFIVYRPMECILYSSSINSTYNLPSLVLYENTTTLTGSCATISHNVPANTSFNFDIKYWLLDISKDNLILLPGPNNTLYTPTVFDLISYPKFCSGCYLAISGRFIQTCTYAIRYIINNKFNFTTNWTSPINNATVFNTTIPYNLTGSKTIYPPNTKFSIQQILEKDLAGNIKNIISVLDNLPINYTFISDCPKGELFPPWVWYAISGASALIVAFIIIVISYLVIKRFTHASEREPLIQN